MIRNTPWRVGSGTILVSELTDVLVSVLISAPSPVILKATYDDGVAVPVATFPAGGYHRKTLRLYDLERLELVGKPKEEFAFYVAQQPLRRGEEIDDLPPPDPSGPNTLIGRLRQRFRQELGVMREEFDARPTRYENAPELFEEDEYEATRRSDQEDADQGAEDGPERQREGEAENTTPDRQERP